MIQFNADRYKPCQAVILSYDPKVVTLIIKPQEDVTPFELYIDLKAVDGTLTEGFYTSDVEKDSSTNSMSSQPFFVRKYQGWGNAYRIYQTRKVNLYIQQFEEDYLVAGRVELETENPSMVEFLHYGAVKEERNEVTKIMVCDPDDYLNNQGNILWGEKTISTPYAFQQQTGEKQRICIINKLLFTDRELEYGVSFEFDSAHHLTSSGSFINDDPVNPFKATFFNDGEIEYPLSSKIDVKYNRKKNEYVLNYQMELPDNQILKGSYKGRIPEGDF
ncbi:hypothetical protein D0T85_20450 [Bacteroides sp. 519]|nr:hypothetical protein [Bacteroides sp. 519]